MLQRGGLEACLDELRRADALFHQDRREEAVECIRRAFPHAQDDAALLQLCAWVFSNCGCHEEAASAYRRLIELCPDWIDGHRHASSALSVIGRLDEAIAHAKAACDLAPQNPEFALHAAALLATRRRCGEAAALALRAAASARDASTVIDAAEVLLRCERADDAA